MKYELNAFDIRRLKELMRLSNDIYSVYEELIDLEVNGQYGTKEYWPKIGILKDLIHKEDFLFDLISEDPDKNAAFMEYLDKETYEAMQGKMSAYILDLTRNKVGLIKARLFNRFAITQIEFREKQIVTEITTIFHTYYIEDLANMVMAILSQEMEKRVNINEKKELLTFIYNYRFLVKRIEMDSLQNNLLVDKNPYLILPSIKDMYGIPDDVFDSIRNKIIVDSFVKNVVFLLDTVKKNQILSTDLMMAILRQSTLRALLVILGQAYYGDMLDATVHFLNIDRSNNSRLAEKMVMDVFSYYEEDKRIPLIVSFSL